MALVLPAVLDIAPVVVPLAALGLVMFMMGATFTRIRCHEAKFWGQGRAAQSGDVLPAVAEGLRDSKWKALM